MSKSPTTYQLAHAATDDPATLKTTIASTLYSIPLKPASKSITASLPFLSSPALLSPDDNTAVVFGGNAIAKALSLMAAGGVFNAEVDEWLEFERTTLRHAGKKVDVALNKIEEALKANGGVHLVGTTTTAADIAIVVTLYHTTTPNLKLPSVVQTYVSAHMSSKPFQEGMELVSNLVPKPFDYTTNPSLQRAVDSVFTTAIESAYPSMDIPTNVQRCSNPKHGDYQCNAAMPLFAKLKKSKQIPEGVKSPQDMAKSIISAVPKDNPVVEQLEVNGPGFILCRIKAPYLEIHMNHLLTTGVPHPPPLNQKCVVDFSSPNIAKEMHVGHLRSTIIGESVCRILEYAGCDVERTNHVGDWGTQFGMLIQYLREEYPGFEKGEDVNITDLTAFYKSAKERFDASPEFKKTSQTNVVALQSGDPECIKIWNILCDISRHEFQKVYDRLDVTVTEKGESFYNEKIPPVIKEFEDAKLISIEEGGAKCIFLPKFKVPLMVQKSDGGYGYDSTDMAALKYRLQTVGAKRIIVITDFSQADHFKMCYSAANMIGWVNPDEHKLEHIGFGTVQGEDGKRFKTRSGDTVRLVDLLDEAVDRMAKELNGRLKDGKANIKPEEVHPTACALGYGAVKYFDLRRNPTTNYKFSYDAMLDTKGNTAIYLLYAHARLESICTKGKTDFNIDVDDLIKAGNAKIQLNHPSEKNLAMYLQMFTDTIELTLEDLFPYHVCDFLYATSNAVSEFVTQCKVLGSEEMESRLLLCRATAMVMRQCFDLLGIRHVMRI